MSPPCASDTPVVLILFNRVDTARRVLERITEARPRQLFVIADGPRPGHQEDLPGCAAARALVDRLEWPCELHLDFSNENLGPKRRISSGLDWVFSQVEEAIILEHDCLPEPTFFRFAQALLERYRLEQRLMMVGGTNYQFGRNQTAFSYYFSIYPHIWGWATWRRAWQSYDIDMRVWPEKRQQGWLAEFLQEKKAARYWTKRFDLTYSGRLSTWDYPWTLACWLQGGLSIIPSVNLVSNIGFGPQALHTTGRHSPYSSMPTQPMTFPLAHPPRLERHVAADNYTQRTVFREHPLAPLKKRIRQLIG